MIYIKIKHLTAQSMNQERSAAVVDTLFFFDRRSFSFRTLSFYSVHLHYSLIEYELHHLAAARKSLTIKTITLIHALKFPFLDL